MNPDNTRNSIEDKKDSKSPYDPKFVEKIERSKKSKGKSIKKEDLWNHEEERRY